MALRFLDGMGHYATANIGAKWDSYSLVTLQPTGGRFGGGSLQSVGFRSLGNFQKTLDNQATWVVGFAIFHTGFNSGVAKQVLLTLFDTSVAQVQVVVYRNGQLGVEVDGSPLAGGVSTTVLTANAWHYVEFQVTISTSIGANTCKVNLDGANVINVTTGQNTRSASSTNNSANSIQFTGLISTVNWDDVYILDGTGSPAAILGDQRIFEQFPDSAGDLTQWTPQGFAGNFQNVNENPADGDATYNQTATLNNEDLYNLQATGASGTINGVQVTSMIRKDDVGARSAQNRIKTGGSTFSGTSTVLISTYVCLLTEYAVNPNTAVAWTVSDLNALQAGIKLTV